MFPSGPPVKVCATIRARSFYRNSNPVRVSDSAGDHLNATDTSRSIRCAVKCLTAFPNCTSYLHNSSTGVCVQALSPDSLVSQLLNGNGDLYVSCDTQNGYHMHRYGSATACLAVIMSSRANFTVASSYCEQIGGYLASVKTWDKLQLLTTAMGNNNSFWVGLDDMDEEGTFVWREDGEVAFKANATFTAAEMAESVMGGLWDHPREPNNYAGNEDCIQVKYSETSNSLKLNDYKCHTRNKYICEKTVRFV